MRRFRFSLERLLEYRRSKAEEARRRFGAVLAETERLTFEVHRIENRREELARRLIEIHLNAQTRRELTEGRSYLEHLWLRMMRLRSDLQTWRERLEEARLDMEEAERDLKAIERLRDRELKRHETDEQRREQNETDEAAINAHLRKKAGEMPDA